MLAIFRLTIILLVLILSFFPIVFLCILRPFNPNLSYLASRPFAWLYLVLGCKIKVQGQEHLRKLPKRAVVISNHQNTYDIFFMAYVFLKNTVSIGKRSLAFIPLFGQLYWLCGNILIKREDKRNAKKSLEIAAKQIVKKNMRIWMFPEGTRSAGRGILPFKSGAFKIAQIANCKIMPLIISNTHNKIKLNRLNNGTVTITYLAPFSAKDLKITDLKKESQEKFEKIFLQN